eukprot:scaffold340_cov256-Pinguiococcus_pyrenoidosus.AAC.36
MIHPGERVVVVPGNAEPELYGRPLSPRSPEFSPRWVGVDAARDVIEFHFLNDTVPRALPIVTGKDGPGACWVCVPLSSLSGASDLRASFAETRRQSEHHAPWPSKAYTGRHSRYKRQIESAMGQIIPDFDKDSILLQNVTHSAYTSYIRDKERECGTRSFLVRA